MHLTLMLYLKGYGRIQTVSVFNTSQTLYFLLGKQKTRPGFGKYSNHDSTKNNGEKIEMSELSGYHTTSFAGNYVAKILLKRQVINIYVNQCLKVSGNFRIT